MGKVVERLIALSNQAKPVISVATFVPQSSDSAR
jgi:hypothetical protein